MLKRVKHKLRLFYVICSTIFILAAGIGLVGCSQPLNITGTTQNAASAQARNDNTAYNKDNQNNNNSDSGKTENKGVTSSNAENKSETDKNSSGMSNYDDFLASFDTLPEYTGNPYIIVNDNTPFFTEADKTTASFEKYGELDSLGRCTTAYANVGKDLMPTEKRGSIGSVKPTGWQTAKYDNVDGKYLYNRCHLIGYQLTAENANKKNLITGTRYLNVSGMLPFENMVADYIKETNNHVLYRVTPVFIGDNLVASGVLMEAESVEDNGDGILFNVYCYNVQPGIVIDYATGDSHQ